MGKRSTVSRSVEDRVIEKSTNQAAQLLDYLTQRGPCHECVFYRSQPGLYCLRLGECYPETRVEWRGRVEGVCYEPQNTRHIVAKV